MSSPTKIQFAIERNVLRYVSGTLNCGIQHSGSAKFALEGYADSDLCGDVRDRKSTSGYVFNFCSGAVSWASKKQDVVALTVTEVEYISLCAACCHGVWMKRIVADFGIQCKNSIPIWCDDKSCIAIAKNPTFHGISKHIDVKFHFIKELVNDKVVSLNFCRSNYQQAYIFTKCLDVQHHCKFKVFWKYVVFNQGRDCQLIEVF